MMFSEQSVENLFFNRHIMNGIRHMNENGSRRKENIVYNEGAETVDQTWNYESERQTDQGSFRVPHIVTVERRVRRAVNNDKKEPIGS